MVVEVVVGVLVQSLALLSDAAHMLTDAGALALSLIVIRIAARPAGGDLTFGLKRTEILSAQANGATLLVLAGLIIYKGAHRLISRPSRGPVPTAKTSDWPALFELSTGWWPLSRQCPHVPAR
jgi:cobalt-zinc-cadmium efflux system protein